MSNSQSPTARVEGLVIQEMPDEVLVYDLDTHKAHCLNQTAALVWKSCDGKNSVTDIKNKLEKEFKTTVPEDMVWLAIDQLSKDKLLEKEIETKISGLSRREVIKKIGFASMVALPVVAMLSFPQSALAVACPAPQQGTQGSCAPGQLCCSGMCVAVPAGSGCPTQ
jgi:hypothetical protein